MKGIITIIVIIAIAVVAFFTLRDGASDTADVATGETAVEESVGDVADIDVEINNAPIDTTAEVIVVTYSDSGFAPKEILVSSGQTVRFVNESKDNMWVASAVHPGHTILPEFDDKKAVGAGENYEFTFTKIGKWNYHNHIKPNATGTVIVE